MRIRPRLDLVHRTRPHRCPPSSVEVPSPAPEEAMAAPRGGPSAWVQVLDHARTDDTRQAFVGSLGQARIMRIEQGTSARAAHNQAGGLNQDQDRYRSFSVMPEETTNGDCLMTGRADIFTMSAVGKPLEGSGDRLGDA